MTRIHASLAVAATLSAASLGAQGPNLQKAKPVANVKSAAGPTVEQFMSPPSPLEFTAAKKTDRLAWVTYERGMRNVYTATAPEFKATRITKFLDDDGVDVGSVRLSDDGSVAIFVRGTAQNRAGWSANPSHDPNGPDRAVWAAKTDGSGAWRLASVNNTEPPAAGGFGGRGGGSPELSPDGKNVVFVRDGQIYHAKVARGNTAGIDTGGVPFIKEWGRQSNPVWSPDGSKIAFVSTRDNHSFIGLYDVKKRTVNFVSPSVDFDGSPTWSADGKRIAFTRRPGTPFGAQTQQGTGGIGSPNGAGAAGANGARGGRNGGGAPGGAAAGRGGRGGRGGGAGVEGGEGPSPDGLYRAAFPGGYNLSFMVADVATGQAREFWHNKPNERVFNNINAIQFAGDHVVFTATPPGDEWDRWYSVSIDSPSADPVLLTTTDGLINDGVADRTFVTTTVSRDGKTFYYATNAKDIEKRHIWAVPVGGGTPTQVSTDDGVEVSPTPLSDGKSIAVLYFGAKQPASIGIVSAAGGSTKVVYPTAAMLKDFPQSAHVEPQIIITHAPDGMEIHNQLFLPKDLKPGEKRPAIVFVHGGPQRQMLPAYHYMQFYHWSYGYNQYLASQGYVVMSINYRLGIGYGNKFRRPGGTQAEGNAEYQDVLAGGKYLQTRADVDPTRIGIWGLSYGGLLVSQALARNSDLFVAGVDMAGVHLYGSSLDSAALSYQSSAAAHVDTWKSPVFLFQGDDDRNVDFSQMIGLVDLLRAHHVYYELTVNPDDVHESLVHGRWIDVWNHSTDFLKRFVWDKQAPPGVASITGKR